MVVDTLEVLGLDPVPRDVLVRLELEHHIADKILDENWVFVGPLGYPPFRRDRLSSEYSSLLADCSISAIKSSIHTVADERIATVTSPRWLCAPYWLIAFEQGQRVVTCHAQGHHKINVTAAGVGLESHGVVHQPLEPRWQGLSW